DVHDELSGYVLNPLVLDEANRSHLRVAGLAASLALWNVHWSAHDALEARRQSGAAGVLALLALVGIFAQLLFGEPRWCGHRRVSRRCLLLGSTEGEHELP